MEDSSFVNYCTIYRVAERLDAGDWCESMKLEFAWVCFNVSTLPLILDFNKLKIFFGKNAVCMVRIVELLSVRFYRLDLDFSSILKYFRDMIVI